MEKIIGKKYVMYIDETGDAGIENLEQPFTLTGVIFEYKYSVDTHETYSKLKEEINKLKQRCFNTTELPLHLTEISRGTGEFKRIDRSKRTNFYHELPSFLSALDFNIISITVDKDKLKYYYEPSKDPYVVAFTHVLQNFYSFISKEDTDSARIVIEARDDFSNLAIQKSFFDVFNNGTTHLNVRQELRDKIKGFIIARKGDSQYQAGLEIADIVCNPLSRVRRGLIEANPKCMRSKAYGRKNLIFAAIKNKIYTSDSIEDFRNWGFKKVPIVKKRREWGDDPVSL